MTTRTLRRRRLLGSLGALACASVASTGVLAQASAAKKPFRIFHVMSFDSPWRWTDGQLAGFKEGLNEPEAQFRVFQMDVKRNSTSEAKERKGQEARAIIEAWQPDLVYTTDDDAQSFVTRHYANKPLPFVFSGVNREPKAHGLHEAANVTGVLEHEHFVESIRLLQAMVPSARRIAVISDSSPHWSPVIARIRASMAELPGTTLVAVDQVKTFDEFMRTMQAYPSLADGVVHLGIFALAGPDGKNVPYQKVQQWVVEHTRLPEVSFWIDRIHHGVLGSVTVSEREQGRAAGRLARAILVEGKRPDSLPVQPTVKGHPAISLARARQLGIPVKSSLLLSAEVVPMFEWEKPPR